MTNEELYQKVKTDAIGSASFWDNSKIDYHRIVKDLTDDEKTYIYNRLLKIDALETSENGTFILIDKIKTS